MDEAQAASPARGLTIAFRIVAALGGLLFVVPNLMFNVQSLGDMDGQGIHVVHNMSGLVGFSVLAGIPMLLLVWRPRQVALLRVIAAVGVATLIGAAAGGVLGVSMLIPVVFAVALVALSPDRRAVFRLGSPSIPLLALTFIAAIPLVVAAFDQADLQGGITTGDEHHEFLHYAGMAITYLGLVLAAAVSAFPGRAMRTARVLVGGGGMALSLLLIAKQHEVGSVDPVWAAAGLAVATVYLVYGWIEAGRAEA